MSTTSTMNWECRLHSLKFDYPDDWDKQGLLPPSCPLCFQQKLTELERKYKDVTSQRDRLLDAINLKLTIPMKSDV